MIRSLWIAKTGLDAQQTQLDVISNNLANISTSGFKRSRAVFEDLIYQTLRQPGAQSSAQTQIPTGLQIGTGVRAVSTERIHTTGSLSQTGNDYDVAIRGAGFFQISMPDGTTTYTRDGSFHIDNQGTLVTASGYPLSPQIQVPLNALSVTIANDGTVTATMPGTPTPANLGNITIANFINPAGLQSVGENLFVETASSGTPTPVTPGLNGTGALAQKYIETSNVNVAEELVNMIQTQRAYEMNSRSVQTSDQMLAKLTSM
jgi:flagellar basal-body rod protein FlgG